MRRRGSEVIEPGREAGGRGTLIIMSRYQSAAAGLWHFTRSFARALTHRSSWPESDDEIPAITCSRPRVTTHRLRSICTENAATAAEVTGSVRRVRFLCRVWVAGWLGGGDLARFMRLALTYSSIGPTAWRANFKVAFRQASAFLMSFFLLFAYSAGLKVAYQSHKQRRNDVGCEFLWVLDEENCQFQWICWILRHFFTDNAGKLML